MVKEDVLERGVRCAAPEGPAPGVTIAFPVIFIVAKPPPPRDCRRDGLEIDSMQEELLTG